MMKRDTHSQALINNDVQSLNKYKQERELHRRVEKLSLEMNNIRTTLIRVTEVLEKIENT